MWFALLVLAVAALVVFVVLARRGEKGEVRSVRSHQGTMATMERLESRAVSRAPAVPGFRPGHDEVPEAAVRSGTTAAGGPPVARPARLVFDDAEPVDPRLAATGAATGIRRDRRSHEHALASMNRASRQGSTILVVVVLLILAGVLSYLAVHHPSHRSPSRAASTTATSHGNSSQPAATHGSHAPHGHHRTTPAPPSQLVATASTATTATYSVPAASYTLVVSASQSCWVQATSEPSGSVLWQGVLPPGASQTISSSGRVAVSLGAAGASMKVDGVPVVVPSGSVTPFTASFVAPGS